MKLLYVSMNVSRMAFVTWQSWHRVTAYPVSSFLESILVRMEQRTPKAGMKEVPHRHDGIPKHYGLEFTALGR